MWIILSGAYGLYHCCIQFFHSEELNNEKPLIHSYLQVQWHKDSPKIVIIISWLTPTKDAWLFYIQVSCCCNVNWKKKKPKNKYDSLNDWKPSISSMTIFFDLLLSFVDIQICTMHESTLLDCPTL